MISFAGGDYIPGRPLNPNHDPPDNITFQVRSYSIMLGEIYPYPHQWYKELHLQGIIDCFGKNIERRKERLTICFLPFDWSPTKPLTDFASYGGMIFVNFKEISSYIDLLRNYSVMAIISETDPRYNRLFTSHIQKDSSNPGVQNLDAKRKSRRLK